MFRAAAAFYEPLLAVVLLPVKGKGLDPQGRGVMLTPRHVLTARHVVAVAMEVKAPSFVRCARGTWQCSHAWDDPASDMAILKLNSQVSGEDIVNSDGMQFPVITHEMLQIGNLVAFMCEHQTKDKDTGQESKEPTLQVGYVSRRETPVDNHPRFRLTNCFAVGGFSGAPLFAESGLLVGVHVQSSSWVAEVDETKIPVIFAVESPIQPVRQAILDHLV